MSKSLRIVSSELFLLIISLVIPGTGKAQPMPEKLNMELLLSQPKYRNIHHDSFCRADNESEIGNNARPERPKVLAYETMSKGTIQVGIRNNCATNSYQIRRGDRCIKYIDTKRDIFHITAVRNEEGSNDLKIAFYIQDIYNFYYAKLTPNKLEVYCLEDGRIKRVYIKAKGGKRLELQIKNKNCCLLVDGVKFKKIKVGKKWQRKSNLCGLFFDDESVSMVEDFIVDYPDRFEDVGVDAFVENDLVECPTFGSYCAEIGACTTSSMYTNRSKRSFRFELSKPTQDQVDKNRDNALHSTIMLDCKKDGGYKPLDSFILSVDVLFPNEGAEAWQLDELFAELFIQIHHAGYNIPFSPSLSIIVNKGRWYLSTTWMETIAKGTSSADNELFNKAQYIGRLNNDIEEQQLENRGFGNYSRLPYFKKGEWHNVTLYVKLGYNINQVPRTVLYVDDSLVIDWNTPNAYNCQEYGEFLEFGLYKWDWNTGENRDKTPIKRRVLYFDNIRYYN